MDEAGNVSINGEPLDEPYLVEKALGECDVEFPYQVPEERYLSWGITEAFPATRATAKWAASQRNKSSES